MGKRKSYCEQCGRPDMEAGRISKRGLCADCGQENMVANNTQLAAGSGPAYNLYVRRQRVGIERWQAKLDAAYREHEARSA